MDGVAFRFGSISNVMFGMLREPIAAFSPVWKTRNPTLLRPLTGFPKKSTSLPKATFSAAGDWLVALPDTWIPRLPVPNGGLPGLPVTPNEPYGPGRRSAMPEPIVLRSITPQWAPTLWFSFIRVVGVSLPCPMLLFGMFVAAYAPPATAANSAMNANAIAGDGRRSRLLITSGSDCTPSPFVVGSPRAPPASRAKPPQGKFLPRNLWSRERSSHPDPMAFATRQSMGCTENR